MDSATTSPYIFFKIAPYLPGLVTPFMSWELTLLKGLEERVFHSARAGRCRDDCVRWVPGSKGTDWTLARDEVEMAVDGKHLGF